jgi:putative acetyltransferase
MPEVRPEDPRDFAGIRVVHERAFAPSPDEADIVDVLRSSAAHVPRLCLVAVRDGEIVGHIAFSRGSLDSGRAVLVLGPMAVLPEHQRQGVGSALVVEGLRRAAGTDFPMVVLVGHPAYYPRFGFEPAEPLGVAAPLQVPSEAWMARRLPAYREDDRGAVAFPAAFGI